MNRRNFLTAALLAAAAVPRVSAAAQKGAGGAVSFPNAGLKLAPPAGFAQATNFDGFQQAETSSSVMVARIPGPFGESTRGFTAERLAEGGMTLVRKAEVTVDGLPGVLLRVKQETPAGTFGKWIVAFGDAQRTYMVSAAFPEAQAAKVELRLKAAVLSATRDAAAAPAADAGLPFTVTPGAKLKLTTTVGKTLLYTKDGVIPAKSPADPLFIVAPSVGMVAVADAKEFARKRLLQTDQIAGVTVTSHAPLKVDGLSGYETVANATDAASGTPLPVYQTMLFDGGGYILMQGLVGAAQGGAYVPEFKKAARSLKRKSAQKRA